VSLAKLSVTHFISVIETDKIVQAFEPSPKSTLTLEASLPKLLPMIVSVCPPGIHKFSLGVKEVIEIGTFKSATSA